MLSRNTQKISRLIQQLREKIQKDDLDDCIIFGSAAVTLNGNDLRRVIDDLDLFVSESAYSRIKAKYSVSEVEKTEGVVHLCMGIPKIEFWKSFPGVTYEQVRKHAKKLDHSGGFPVADAEDLRIWKQAQGREKDLKDLKNMD